MTEQTQMRSLEETDGILPVIAKALDGIFELNDQIVNLKVDMAVLYDIWGLGLLDARNPDNAHFKDLSQRRALLQQRLEHAVSELQKLGCIVDVKRGIVRLCRT